MRDSSARWRGSWRRSRNAATSPACACNRCAPPCDWSAGDIGSPIQGVEAAEEAGALVFHAGTARRGDRLVTNGGRILNVTATGDTLDAARAHAYGAVNLISFEGMRYRSDIALEASLV